MASFTDPGKVALPAAFSAFQIMPKDAEEEADTNMPRDCGKAMMVFLGYAPSCHEDP